MPTIQIRDLPENVHEYFQQQARAAGQSLQAFMRQELVDLAERRVRRAAVLTEMEEIIRADPGPGLTIEEILEARDAERR